MNKPIKIGLGVVVAAGLSTAPAYADDFVMCPDGHEGVVGDHTTCAFAENVRKGFFLLHQPAHFTAYSPVTGQPYAMECGDLSAVHFVGGAVVNGVRCVGGERAEVVIW